MSIGGTFLVVITASVLKPLLSTNQSLQQPLLAVFDRSNTLLPFEENNGESDGASKFYLTFRLPQLPASDDLDMKRQFDPWGGKRLSQSATKNKDARKRQFSPWGGKRSSMGDFMDMDDNGSMDKDNGINLSGSKMNLNSWGGKRGYGSWSTKRNFDISDEKKNFNSWGGKRSFNAWGGKRFIKKGEKNLGDILYEPKTANIEDKRQSFNSRASKRAFNSWGGKRAFNSWGGKRSFNSWGGKRDSSVETNEFSNSENDALISSIKAIEEGTDNMYFN